MVFLHPSNILANPERRSLDKEDEARVKIIDIVFFRGVLLDLVSSVEHEA